MAAEIMEALRPRINAFTARVGRAPMLGLLLAGNDSGSEIYVRGKIKDSAVVGLKVDLRRVSENGSLAEALSIVSSFNGSDIHDGILVQSPLPAGMGAGATQQLFDAINPMKDVDGFNPVNVGYLVQKRPALVPCTPTGIMDLLERSDIPIAGKRAVVIGRSDIVGKPIAMLLLHRNATVTICHSRTTKLASVAASADILIAAIGTAGFVTRDFIKPGATVIDVGVSRLTKRTQVEKIFGGRSKKMAAFEKRGSVLSGDVHPNVAYVAGALTPVPGGVGPLTRACLLLNTVRAAEARVEKKE